jgi:hypothetical protein
MFTLKLPGKSVEQKGAFELKVPSEYLAPELRPKRAEKPMAKAKPKPAPPKSEPMKKAAPKSEERIESLELVSIVGSGRRATVVLRKLPSKKTVMLREGQMVGDFIVVEIDTDSERVTIQDKAGKKSRLKVENQP